MNLTFLSLQRVRRGRVLTHTPSNEERVAAFRAFRPPLIGNAYPWPHKAAAYAAEQSPPPADEVAGLTYDQLSDGF
ncbi:hypothetical protein [Lysobacter enzymogenes]|nr:hypothetical protein [Lysobacter enzymogenes]QQP96509.1 hypothetical protein JHW38_00165 [Lysobacter enzymogenes]